MGNVGDDDDDDGDDVHFPGRRSRLRFFLTHESHPPWESITLVVAVLLYAAALAFNRVQTVSKEVQSSGCCDPSAAAGTPLGVECDYREGGERGELLVRNICVSWSCLVADKSCPPLQCRLRATVRGTLAY